MGDELTAGLDDPFQPYRLYEALFGASSTKSSLAEPCFKAWLPTKTDSANLVECSPLSIRHYNCSDKTHTSTLNLLFLLTGELVVSALPHPLSYNTLTAPI